MLGMKMLTKENLEKSVALTVTARIAIVAASLFLPIAATTVGWLLNRAVHTVDHLAHLAEKTQRSVDRIEVQLDNNASMIKDHEIRIRAIENQRFIFRN